jgi:L,D-transpeptidase catalytic domain
MVMRNNPALSSRAKLAGGAAAIGLVCLGGMATPADAYSGFSYGGGGGYYGGFGERLAALPASHRSRKKHTDSTSDDPAAAGGKAKGDKAVKKEPPKQPSGPLVIVVSIGSQHVTVYDDGTPIASAPISSGMPGHPTPVGIFSVIQKDRYHHSNIYSGAPMPYMQRITWSGVAMHEGVLPGHPASHGCIRLPHEFAARLWTMTKMGVRVVVTPRNGNDVVPVAFDHPRLVALATKPAAPDVAATPARTGQAAPVALPAFSSLAPPSAAPQKSDAPATTATLGEGIDASGDSPLPPLEAVAMDQRPGDLRPALITLNDPPPAAEAPAAVPAAPPVPAAAPERPLKPGLVSVFVSRKLGKLYVRKGNEPIFDMPITISHPEQPIGTYVFTAGQPTGDGGKLRWLATSVASGRATVEPPSKKSERGRREAKAAPPPPAPMMSSTSPAEALDRIQIPQEALDLVAPLVTPGASLIVSDLGMSGETGKDTDFIILAR